VVKEHLRNLPLIILSLVLAFFLTFTLLYFNFYVHELGHYITGAGDADRKFADYFIRKLSEKI